MLKLLLLLFLVSGVDVTVCTEEFVDGCNEFVCGSVVSKCLLMQSCQCSISDCFCCRDCFHCLGELYADCCNCLDMCPKHNETLSALAPRSQIGIFEGVPELFETLTAEEDDDEWSTIRFSMRPGSKPRYDKTVIAASPSGGDSSDAINRQGTLQKLQASEVNCTVIYLNMCTTNRKCMQYCESMGASSYRWFHVGCCECVGANCSNYGINESHCLACPEYIEGTTRSSARGVTNVYEGAADDAQWDYGEHETS